ncbi:uncharacterized protein LOC111868065 [Cryptotermes secundus]|uniref:uncharacterized protein LOC111868065 n=1 Tax=Cryptotermes secundus TaxID=105785 RepID=UPI000CD7D10B|nr:uncharacterized protein LOC111868065 [Cryptotermes secundus]
MTYKMLKCFPVTIAAVLCLVSCNPQPSIYYYERAQPLYSAPYERIIRYYPADNIKAIYRNANNFRSRPYDTRRMHVGDHVGAESRGTGSYRMLSPADAELQCRFPDSENIVSNVVWLRGDPRRLYRVSDARNGVLYYPKGSVLYLKQVTPYDAGLYRCMATARNPDNGKTHTVFQDVDFYPRV